MPLQATSGAASYDAFGGGVAAVPTYIEDVFSTWLYTGDGTLSRAINNGIDLAGKGGLVWLRERNPPTVADHCLVDSQNGASNALRSNTTDALASGIGLGSFTSTGFTTSSSNAEFFRQNSSGRNLVTWTFREQQKFFDVVTYTGNGTQPRTITHNLGSVPGCIIVKRTDTTSDWAVYHRAVDATTPQGYRLELNTTNARVATTSTWNNQAPTSTEFYIGSATYNANGGTYVAYLFAHDAGGFGLTGTDNVISCGSFTTDSGGAASVTLGYEPQWILYKTSSATGNWAIIDNMRGITTNASTNTQRLKPNLSDAEDANTGPALTATGFNMQGGPASGTVIYIAIRRGPMRTPTTGTSVFEPVTYTGNGATTRVLNTTITPDAGWFFHRDTANGEFWFDRLRGGGRWLQPSTASSESSWTGAWLFDVQNAVQISSAPADYINGSGALNGLWALKRAPGFFDEVCWSGEQASPSNQVVKNVNHNLGVAPELIITKSRNNVINWFAYHKNLTSGYFLRLNLDGAETTSTSDGPFPSTATYTATTFGTAGVNNASGNNYVAYLFASCPGVSKVFNYTGNGSSQTINCGFTGGARFVMIKRTDSTGDWYVWDTARGIVANNDPHLSLNSTAAEVTTNDTIDTDSTGFVVNQVSATNVNVNGASYIGLAIA